MKRSEGRGREREGWSGVEVLSPLAFLDSATTNHVDARHGTVVIAGIEGSYQSQWTDIAPSEVRKAARRLGET